MSYKLTNTGWKNKYFLITCGRILSLLCFLLAANNADGQYIPSPAVLNSQATTPGSFFNETNITLSNGFWATATSANTYSYSIGIPEVPCTPLATTPSGSQNYIMVSVPRIGGITTTDGLANRTACELMQTIQYFDGLGRPLQTVQVKGSSGYRDVVQPFTYDAFGREEKKYLPYTALPVVSNGSYKNTAITDQSSFYTDPSSPTSIWNAPGVVAMPAINGVSPAFSQTGFESSPLNRVLEQGSPGADWQLGSHTIKIEYSSNDQSMFNDAPAASNSGSRLVALYRAEINADQSRTLQRLNNSATYDNNQLYVTITRDENWQINNGCIGTIEEYKDKEGRVVLKRTYNKTKNSAGSDIVEMLSTYYVYDDLGNLCFVVPPKASPDATGSAISQATLNNLCYQYRYDERNRISQKKLPGKEWEFTVYNTLDQAVATQDGLQRGNKQWLYTKYDALGRIVSSGIWTNGNIAISRADLQALMNGQTIFWDTFIAGTGYNNAAWPNVSITVLSVNYYDSYAGIPSLPAYAAPPNASTMTTGLPVATQVAVLNNPADKLWSVSFYDDEGRNIKTYKQHYLGGTVSANNYDAISNTYDFTNVIATSKREHFNTTSTTAAKVTIDNIYRYDHMGRKVKTFEKINSGNNILLSQSDYNEVGQLRAKHLHGATGAAPFLQDVNYAYNERGWLSKVNEPSTVATTTQLFAEQLYYNIPQLGGTAQYNGNISGQDYRVFNLTHPALQATLYSYDNLNRLKSGVSSSGFTEKDISYDPIGNILTLNRMEPQSVSLNYIYDGNQLLTVNNSGAGYRSYNYDLNGNATTDGLGSTINYNLFNLPQNITAKNLTYVYDATGNKLRKVSGSRITEYISGIQYDGTAIDFIQTEEGRAINSSGTYKYEYTLTDHLGNNRVTFDETSGKIGEEDYYPFGLNVHRQTNAGNKYLYNKKEIQEDLNNQYDYGARFYDPVIARFTTIDRFAEKYKPLNPYQYAALNPISNIDMNGDSTWNTTTRVANGRNITETRTTHITGKVLNSALSSVSSGDLAASVNARLNAQRGTESYTNDQGGTTTINYTMDANYQGVSSMDQVNSSDHLLVTVNSVTGSADPQLGGGDATGFARLGGKVAFIEVGSGLANMTNMAFHEIGHNLGLEHPNANNASNPMSYTGQNANFSSGQLRDVYLNNVEHSLNRGQNSMTIGNRREINNFNSTQNRPYIGTRRYGMKVPMPIEHH